MHTMLAPCSEPWRHKAGQALLVFAFRPTDCWEAACIANNELTCCGALTRLASPRLNHLAAPCARLL